MSRQMRMMSMHSEAQRLHTEEAARKHVPKVARLLAAPGCEGCTTAAKGGSGGLASPAWTCGHVSSGSRGLPPPAPPTTSPC